MVAIRDTALGSSYCGAYINGCRKGGSAKVLGHRDLVIIDINGVLMIGGICTLRNL